MCKYIIQDTDNICILNTSFQVGNLQKKDKTSAVNTEQGIKRGHVINQSLCCDYCCNKPKQFNPTKKLRNNDDAIYYTSRRN